MGYRNLKRNTTIKRAMRILAALAVFTACLTLAAFALVAVRAGTVDRLSDLRRLPEGERLPRFVDDCGLLSTSQAEELTRKLDEISERQQFDVVVVVVDSLGDRDARLYAADFYEQNGFGGDVDGLILLLAMEARDYAYATTGYGLEVFTPSGQDYFETFFLPLLSKDRYFEAFTAYAEAADDFLDAAKAGEPYTGAPKTAWGIFIDTVEHIVFAYLIPAVLSLLMAWWIARAVITEWEKELQPVGSGVYHNSIYLRNGSFYLTVKEDQFLRKNTKKTYVPPPPDKTTGGGSSFTSSSGGSWSGGSGKF